LVMEKVEGESLAARRRKKQPLSHEQVLRFLHDAAESLRYLHGHAPPIVHRDIKPGNVILRPDGSYCLVDFGSVRDSLKPEGGSTVVGTFGFMAPEQFQGRAAPVSDVYAVGATAISLITGREPEELPHKGLGIDVESALKGLVDRRLVTALRSMLEPDPDRRVGSVARALQLAGLTADTRRGSGKAEDAKKARRARLEAEAPSSPPRPSGKAERHRTRNAKRKAEREARQAHKNERRHARRDADGHWRRPGRQWPPAIVLGILILFALQIASIATFALFQVLLPMLFTFIPARGRRERMLQIGHAGQRGLRTASAHIRHHFLGGPVAAQAATLEAQAEALAATLEAQAEELEARAHDLAARTNVTRRR